MYALEVEIHYGTSKLRQEFLITVQLMQRKDSNLLTKADDMFSSYYVD